MLLPMSVDRSRRWRQRLKTRRRCEWPFYLVWRFFVRGFIGRRGPRWTIEMIAVVVYKEIFELLGRFTERRLFVINIKTRYGFWFVVKAGRRCPTIVGKRRGIASMSQRSDILLISLVAWFLIKLSRAKLFKVWPGKPWAWTWGRQRNTRQGKKRKISLVIEKSRNRDLPVLPLWPFFKLDLVIVTVCWRLIGRNVFILLAKIKVRLCDLEIRLVKSWRGGRCWSKRWSRMNLTCGMLLFIGIWQARVRYVVTLLLEWSKRWLRDLSFDYLWLWQWSYGRYLWSFPRNCWMKAIWGWDVCPMTAAICRYIHN